MHSALNGYVKAEGDLLSSTLSEALLYSTFNIALVFSSLPTFLKNYPRNVRLSLLVLGIVASYGFFLGVTLLADRL